MNKKILLGSIVLLVFTISGFYISSSSNDTNNLEVAVNSNGFGTGQKAILYKSPECGCCAGYANELENQGFEVKIIPTDDMESVKNKYDIPADKQSCHTIAMGDYFVEGHVPMKAVEKMLKEHSDIKGIGLPGMPAGTPGMGGSKRSPYEVYQIKNGVVSSFVTI